MEQIFSQKSLTARQDRAAKLLKSQLPEDTLVVIYAGQPITKPGGLDQQYYFLPTPEYLWIAGNRRPGGCMCYSLSEGWVHFAKAVTTEEMVWEGAAPFCHELDISDLEVWTKRKGFKKLAIFGSGSQMNLPELSGDSMNLVKNALDRARRPKDEEEINLIKDCAKAALAGYRHLRNFIREGVTERQIQIEFEYETFKAGSHRTPYETIVGAAERAAVLHALPTEKKVRAGDLVLIDAGADIHDYCVDITRIFYADQKPTTQQREIFEIVHKAQLKAIETARPGVEWHECHKAAAHVIGQGLIDLGLIRGSLQEILELGVVGQFFPHGVGHMVGQRVRDVGGAQLGRPARKVYGNGVRVDLPLEENFLMTFEPGLYFIEALLMQEKNREKFKDIIQYSKLDSWLKLGGIRIEDDVLIRQSGNINLTADIPL